MRNKYTNVKCVYRGLREHNGLEIDKYFKTEMPPKNMFYEILAAIAGLYKKINKKTKLVDNTSGGECENESALYIYGYKPHKKYLEDLSSELQFRDIVNANAANKSAIETLKLNNVVGIHVRRGDYLTPTYAGRYVDLSSSDYYSKAIGIVCAKIESPLYFVFSDDIPWCKDNLILPNAQYIDWNTGCNSYMDMYLMSLCKGLITANSTFSFFGGLLGRKEKIVVYPDKWYTHKPTPDIFPDNWIKLEIRK